MPEVTLSESVFARLQAHAVPLKDTVDTVILRALDALALKDTPQANQEATPPRPLNPAAPPNLSHTTPKSIKVGGHSLKKGDTYWNTLMYTLIRKAAETMTIDAIDKFLFINSVIGKKEDNGYKFLSDVGISAQGQDANAAWKQSHLLAKHLNLPVEVIFTWQNTEKAAMPNSTGSFSMS